MSSKNVFKTSAGLAVAGLVIFLAVAGNFIPPPVEAQSSARSFYVEPGVTTIRNPDGGGSLGDGKMVIDLKTGDVWGFPTSLMGSPYPVDPINKKPPIAKGIYLGRFDFVDLKVP
jgi:hypothetical protein